ncbi:hypothetical protein KP509_16G021700 [Ceratopteris richardii]|uniref:deoxyhypusine synthase n=1 Tax=Ceratopteris richardii TaxID=49495 RepID=A0A8T2SX49_CERRI|nr:hypothetical protein KP509_16G021700 [Ceratopteris richardii]
MCVFVCVCVCVCEREREREREREPQLDWRLIHEPMDEGTPNEFKDPEIRRNTKCKIFLSFTSNMVSCGVRETIRFLVQHKMVDVLCTTAGGIEEDLMKSMSPSFLADFSLPGASLREKGLNRIGNLVVPNNSYADFGRWLTPILDQLLVEQNEKGVNWTPSKFISRLGKELNHPDSICYWAYKNNIPIYCPAITDGAIGDSLFFHSHSNPGLRMDIIEDVRRMDYEAIFADPRKTGMIILGGGLAKHHVCNANMMRNGAEFAVYINTAQEFDGSDSGAKPEEAKSWGKIKVDAKAVKVYCDASIAFPLLVAQTFAPRVLHSQKTVGIQQSSVLLNHNQVPPVANGCASAKQPKYLQSVN